MGRKLLLLLLFCALISQLGLAGTRGKIKGKVTDLKTGEVLIGANVLVVGTSLGAATDANGDFVIYNIEPGTYEVKASYIGYQTITLSNVRVNSDLTTELDVLLPAEGYTVETVEVVAARPLVNKSNTNAVRVTTSEDIQSLPVRGINNVIGLTAGVVLKDNVVFIRGGRLDEVGYYLEGVSITNPVTGGRAVTIIQDAVEEIQVQAGGYTAEFGGANAGIIRQALKTGPKSLKATVEYTTDNVGFNSKSNAYDGKKRLGTYWFGYSEFTGTVGFPILNEKYRFFGLFNSNYQRDANPQPYPGINLGKVGDITSGDTVNLVYPAGAVFGNAQNSYTGTATLHLDFNPVIVRFAGTYTTIKGQAAFNSHRNAGNIANFMNTNRIESADQDNANGSLKITHLLNPTTYYEVTVGYLMQKIHNYDPYLKDNFLGYGDSVANANAGWVWNRSEADIENGRVGRYTRPTRMAILDWSFNAPGEILAGYRKAKRENLSFTGALTSQVGKEHSIKIGGEYQRYSIRNYSWGNEGVFALPKLLEDNAKLADGDPQKRTVDEIFRVRALNSYGYDAMGNETDEDGYYAAKHPVFAAAYIQDKIEYADLVINAGLRFDYIDTDNKKFKDPRHPEYTFAYSNGELLPGGLEDVPTFSALSPRIGLSFPVTDRTVFHTQFGKFVQQTRLNDLYQGYGATFSNVKGGFFINIPIGFDLRPTRTTQYEVGFTQQVGEVASFDITGYYKDIKDQVVYDLQRTDPTSPYQGYYVLRNGDFATTKGLELSFNLRRIERVAVNASLSFQDAQGTGSFPNSNRGIVGAPLDGVTVFNPQYVSPLEFNNAFRGNVNIDYRFGKDDGPAFLQDLGASLLMKFNSGHPYTKGVGGQDLEGDARDRRPVEPLNASSTPSVFQVDLRIDKTFRIYDKLSANIYVFVVNLFDRKNIENVFLRTGSTTDDGVLSNPANASKLSDTYINMYNAIYLDYYERYQNATGLYTAPYFYGAPRQIRLGIRLEY